MNIVDLIKEMYDDGIQRDKGAKSGSKDREDKDIYDKMNMKRLAGLSARDTGIAEQVNQARTIIINNIPAAKLLNFQLSDRDGYYGLFSLNFNGKGRGYTITFTMNIATNENEKQKPWSGIIWFYVTMEGGVETKGDEPDWDAYDSRTGDFNLHYEDEFKSIEEFEYIVKEYGQILDKQRTKIYGAYGLDIYKNLK